MGQKSQKIENSVTIDMTLCKSCGECVKVCRYNFFTTPKKHVDPINGMCYRCFRCYAVCPNGAIKVTGPYKQIETDRDKRESIDKNNLEQFLAFRRSIRRFGKKKVTKKIIEEVISAARYIPSGGNLYAHEFTVIKNAAIKKRLIAEFKKVFQDKPIFLRATLPWYNKIFYNASIAIVIHSKETIGTPKDDSILAAYNIVLMAQALGLGTCFFAFAQNAINASKRCKAILKLSLKDHVHSVVLLGYPEIRFRRIVPKPQRPARWFV